MDGTNPSQSETETIEKTEDETCKEKMTLIKQPKRLIVVEPILINMALFYFPLRQVAQLFIFGKMKDIVAHNHGYNTSDIFSNSSISSCNANQSSLLYGLTEEAQEYNTYFSMIGSIIGFVPGVFVLLFVGAYSDKAGRKYAILPPIIGGFVNSGIYLLVFVLNLPVWVLWIGDFLYGCSGSFSLLIAGCFSYIADTTSKENRSFRITVAEIGMFFCTILGPIGVGYLIQNNGYLWPLVIAFTGHVINLIYTLFFVPETIIKDKTAKLFTFDNIRKTVNTFSINTTDNRRWKLWLLFLSFFVHYIGSGIYSVTGLFMLSVPLCWGAVTIGYYSTAITAVSTVGGIAAAKIMKHFTSDAVIALITAFVDAFNCIFKGFVQNTAMMFISLIFAPFWNLLTPTTRAMMSTLVEANEQGSAFAAIGIAETVAMLIGSEGLKLVYANTLYIYPGLVFFVGSFFYLAVGFMFIFYIWRSKREEYRYRQLQEISDKA